MTDDLLDRKPTSKSALGIMFAAGDLNLQRYVGSNPISYSDPSGNVLESALFAGDRGVTLGQPIYEIGQGLNCTFGGIASVFTAIDEAQDSGSTVDISVDLKSCSAAAISQAAPLYSDNPVEDSAQFAAKLLFQISVVKFLKAGLPQGPISLTIYPSATPAYPGTWRNR